MKYFFQLFLSFFFLPALTAQPLVGNTRSVSGNGNIYAVVVGISTYQDSTIDQLQFANADAIEFARFLKSKTGGSVPDENIRLLTDSNATQSAVILAVNWLAKVCKKDDIVFFYFSGHGTVEHVSMFNNAFLICYNTLKVLPEGMSLSVDKVNDVAKTLSVQTLANVVLITDACHSGEIATDKARNKLVGEQLLASTEKEIRIASCMPDQLSNENTDWGGGRGVFSYHLINGLKGFADVDNNGIVTLGEIKTYLATQMKNDPVLRQENKVQTPVIKDENEGFLLAKVDKDEFARTRQKVASDSMSQPIVFLTASPLARDPIGDMLPDDYFFSLLKNENIEQLTDTLKLIELEPVQIALALIKNVKDKINVKSGLDKLQELQDELQSSSGFLEQFNEGLVKVFDNKAHDVITQYLSGDVAELERRRYYNVNNNGYDVYPRMFAVALKLIRPDNFFYNILQFKLHYFTGVCLRLKIPVTEDPMPLVNEAIEEQKKALALDMNAVQVFNELGILYLLKKEYTISEKYFLEAVSRNDRWAFPWSNLSALYSLTGNYTKGFAANSKADSLQAGLQSTTINLGYLNEKTGNLLYAEEDYHKAIDINSRHFLPFERLGYVNLNTTKYAEADSFFYEASLRKKGFHFNGNEWLTVEDTRVMVPTAPTICDIDTNHLDSKDIMAFFYWGVKEYEAKHYSNALRILKKVIAADKTNPLVFHYIGKLYYDQKKWKEAEIMFKYAVNYCLDRPAFDKYCDSVRKSKTYPYQHDCFEDFFAKHFYEREEDYYFLSYLYESWKHDDEAELMYVKIIQQYPEKIQGYIKLWQLHEKRNRFIQAENVIRSYKAHDTEQGDIELNDFYRRMIQRYPDNGDWNYKLGILLYSRASQNAKHPFFDTIVWFPKINKEVFIDFEIYGKLKSDPDLKLDMGGRNGETTAIYQPPVKSERGSRLIPGVNDVIELGEPIDLPRFDGIKYLKRAAEIIGERKILAEINYKIANIYVWAGSKKQAYPFYVKSISFEPDNANTRLALVDAGAAIYKYRAVLEQLNYLYDSSQINFPKQLLLVQFAMYAGQFERSNKILQEAAVIYPYALPEYADLMGRLYLLSKKYDMALDFYQAYSNIYPDNAGTLYTMARLSAANGQKDDALLFLKTAIGKGFNYSFVLDSDPLMADLRKTAAWNAVIKNIKPKTWKSPGLNSDEQR